MKKMYIQKTENGTYRKLHWWETPEADRILCVVGSIVVTLAAIYILFWR